VVLTYDDAIPQQLDNAFPVLDSLKLKATFYITAYFAKDRINEWKEVAAKGYELGNHTLYHPCIGGKGREWVKPDYDMNRYTVQRMVDEIKMANVFLETLDGKKKRTFAYTCGDMKVNDTPFIGLLKKDFVAARGVRGQLNTIDKTNLYNIDCFTANNNTAEQMIEWVKKAEANNALLVILFHGVGGGNSLNVSVAEHSKFLHYLKQNEKDIWIAPMIDVAEYIKAYQLKSQK
jgi:sialate O-acetylesterase